MNIEKIEKNLNALLVLIIAAVLAGAIGFQLFDHQTPCALCLLQRLGMIGVATGALLNIKFGPRKAHYGLSLFSAIFGGFVALRQIALHVCPQFPTFGVPFWGLSLYTWSFIVYACSVLYIGVLLMIFDHQDHPIESSKPSILGQIAFIVLFLIALINVFGTLWLCGLSACGDV